MIPFTVLLASLILLGAAVALRQRRSRAGSDRVPPSTASSTALSPGDGGQDLLPEGSGDGDGLAAFYAYQMAAGSIDRPR